MAPARTLETFCKRVRSTRRRIRPLLSPSPPKKKKSDCAILEGRFVWAAAVGVVHRVCRVGRESKAAYGKRMLDRGGAGGFSGGGSGRGSRKKKGAGAGGSGSRASPGAAANQGRPNGQKARRGGRPPARRHGGRDDGRGSAGGGADRGAGGGERAAASGRRRDGGRDERGGGAGSGTVAAATGVDQGNKGTGKGTGDSTEDDAGEQPGKAGGLGAGAKDEQRQPKAVGAAGAEKTGEEEEEEEEEEPDATTLSKEAAFLKADEDTEGGQGAMLFSEFVEALTRLCLKRYEPRAGAARNGLGGAAAPLGIGWKSASASWRNSFAPKHLARRSLNVRRRGGKEFRGALLVCKSASRGIRAYRGEAYSRPNISDAHLCPLPAPPVKRLATNLPPSPPRGAEPMGDRAVHV